MLAYHTGKISCTTAWRTCVKTAEKGDDSEHSKTTMRNPVNKALARRLYRIRRRRKTEILEAIEEEDTEEEEEAWALRQAKSYAEERAARRTGPTTKLHPTCASAKGTSMTATPSRRDALTGSQLSRA